jgi:serine phosphatase RsbU (regulator of sigma subunit)
MNSTSVTSSDSFAARAQRSEAHRVGIWLAVLFAMLVLTLVRRWTHGIVMSDNRLFVPYLTVLVVAIAVQLILRSKLREANRAGELLPGSVWRGSAIFDLATAAALLTVAAFLSPRGPVPALTAPPMLLIPLVVLLSILRLRPDFTLYTGLAGAGFHLLVAIRAIRVSGTADPVYVAYGVVLAMTAVAGWFVARAVRNHVREATDEAAAHERSDRQVFGLQKDLSVARDIQLGLLPRNTPQLPGFDITGMNRPADQTGGDYYDWQPLPDGRLAVVLADVSGHGIGPALVMAVCRAYARSTAPTAPDPAALLVRLNDLLHDDLPADRFITFVVAVLDESGGVSLASAGHGPTLLFRAATGEVTQFGGDGLPLGVMPAAEYGPTNVFTLDDGDALVMLTDGFFEWSRPGDQEQFGIERLTAALRTTARADAATILRKLDETVRHFCDGTPQSDDMTAIVIKRTARAEAQRQESGVRGQVAEVRSQEPVARSAVQGLV